MKKIIAIFLLLVVTINFVSCSPQKIKKDKEDSQPGALENSLIITNNWGLESIDYFKFPCKKIILGVLDTGTNFSSDNIVQLNFDESKAVNDLFDHGTFVIKNLSSLLPNTKIISINVVEENGLITEQSLANGLKKARELKCNVINISLGTALYSSIIQKEVDFALAEGIIIVAAAGNNHLNSLDYPANYEGVISVIGRNPDNIDATTNNTSREKKSFSAPNSIVFDETNLISGNSIATTYVSALVVYLLEMKNTLTNLDVLLILQESSIYSTSVSYGMINFERAKNLLEANYM